MSEVVLKLPEGPVLDAGTLVAELIKTSNSEVSGWFSLFNVLQIYYSDLEKLLSLEEYSWLPLDYLSYEFVSDNLERCKSLVELLLTKDIHSFFPMVAVCSDDPDDEPFTVVGTVHDEEHISEYYLKNTLDLVSRCADDYKRCLEDVGKVDTSMLVYTTRVKMGTAYKHRSFFCSNSIHNGFSSIRRICLSSPMAACPECW